jgi:hypothetical protein
MRLRPIKLYKESMKQKVGSLRRLARSKILSQHDKTEEGKGPN